MFRIIILFLFLWTKPLFAETNNSFIALCYHDIRNDLTDDLDSDQFAIGSDALIAQFSWLKAHNYHVISIDDLMKAMKGEKNLPEKAILLSFDDGYASVYKILFPLLKAYHYSAVVAVVGTWLQPKMNTMVHYGDRYLKPRSDFLSWQQIKEMSDSGLVEIASHSYNLHHGILANPQGNVEPAAVTRAYNKGSQTYSNDHQYRQRILTDLQRNSALIKKHTGKRPRVMVWPYGEYSYETIELAAKAGMPFTLTLRDGSNKLSDSREIRRVLIEANPKLKDFVYTLEHINKSEPIRAVRVPIETLYNADANRANANLGHLIDKIKALKINTVFLQAVADRDGDGLIDTAYFPNRHLKMVGDFLNRVEWQLETRAQLNVYAWMPSHSFSLLNKKPANKAAILQIYEDLAKSTQIDGILFADYPSQTKATESDSDPAWLKQLSTQVKYYRPEIKTALAVSPTISFNTIEDSINTCCDYRLIELALTTTTDGSWKNLIMPLFNSSQASKKLIVELSMENKQKNDRFLEQNMKMTYLQLMQLKAIQLSYYPFNWNIDSQDFNILKSTISLRKTLFRP
ncbi:MAG: poly-beta-1,6-N-acetyl-D-glucosamine N-deacetylase PgaB [Methylococcales bacterium]